MAIDSNEQEYWLKGTTAGRNHDQNICMPILAVDNNSHALFSFPVGKEVEVNGISKAVGNDWTVLSKTPSGEFEREYLEYKTKGMKQIPSANLAKFAFSFRANGIRITLIAEASEDACIVKITNSSEKDKQGKVTLGFMKKIEDLIKQHKLYEWAGFNEGSPNHQYICESFFLEIEFEGNPKKSEISLFNFRYMEKLENSTNIYAEGSSSFPRDFFDVKREVFKLFDSVKLKKSQDFDTINH